MFICQYGKCQNEATTKGFVIAKEGGKDIRVDVLACDKHRKVNSFFEKAK
jgi:hypothetical protein